jgi:hypothetical protein
MSLNKIVGGRAFTPGKFSRSLNSLTRFGDLKNFKTSILKVSRDNTNAIRDGRFKSERAMHSLEKEQRIDYKTKRDIEHIFKRLEKEPTSKEASVIESKKEIISRALKSGKNDLKTIDKGRIEKKPLKIRINKADSEFNKKFVKDNRVSALQDRLHGPLTSVSSQPDKEQSKVTPSASLPPTAPSIPLS